MNARHRHKLPEDNELRLKETELAALRARHAEARASLQRLRDEIASFENFYHHDLGSRIAELERIEAEISRLSGYAKWEQPQDQSASSQEWEEACKESAQDSFGEHSSSVDRHASTNFEAKDIKALYREVAKTIHPDLAGTGPSKVLRHELMLKANRAYAEDDRRTLQEILRNWRRSPDQAEGGDASPDLARLTRLIARERQEIRAVNAKLEELKASYVCRFKKRVDANLALGIDLLADMVADADLDIARALKRLAALQGERPKSAVNKPSKPKRKVNFTGEICSGTAYLREQSSSSYHNWKRLGPASGCLEIEVDQALRLDIKGPSRVAFRQLHALEPDDLQALFLYEVEDSDLDGILHLTGLEELYLSGPQLTDAALSRLGPLSNLKRIYLYQTGISDAGLSHLLYLPGLRELTSSGNGITDAGLAAFQLATQGVKTVSFAWKK